MRAFTLAVFHASSAMAFITPSLFREAHWNKIRCSQRIVAAPRMSTAASPASVSDTLFDDWKASTTFFFPGQGAQYVGMAGKLVADVPKAKEMFDHASEILGYDLLKICLEGPKDKLDSTVISQPAIYVASLAAVEKLRADSGQAAIDKVTVAAGLSLGEYTALSFAGAMSFDDGLRLVKARGEAMQASSAASAQTHSRFPCRTSHLARAIHSSINPPFLFPARRHEASPRCVRRFWGLHLSCSLSIQPKS